jgi:hypothetical protein
MKTMAGHNASVLVLATLTPTWAVFAGASASTSTVNDTYGKQKIPTVQQ